MSMVINTNVQANRTHGVYNRNNTYMNEAMTRVATGQKINSAKDNASLWAITQRMRDRIRANDQANQNVQNDNALLKTAQGGIDNTVSILTTLKERAINSANDSNLNLDRDAIAIEVKQLTQQIDDNASKVKFNGRYLLNGAVDPSATSETQEETAITKNPNIVEPEAAGMPAYKKDGTTTGSHAVYMNNTLVKYGTGATATAASDTKLTELVKSDATASTDTIFKAGDKITFSWKEDGKENSYTYEVTTGSTVNDLAFDVGAVHFYNESTTSATNLVSKSAGTYKVENDAGTETPYNKSDVYNNASTRAQKQSSTDNSKQADLYAVGDYGVKITDFKVSVTYTGVDGNEATRTDAQKALKLTGMQQAAEYDPTTTGTATIFKATNTGGNITTDSTIADLGLISNGATDDLVTFKWGDGENDSVTLSANSSIASLQTALGEKGISLYVYPGKASSTTEYDFKDADGNFVKYTGDNFGSHTEGTNFKVTQNTTAADTDLYFVSKTGVRLDKDDFAISATSADGSDSRTVTQLSLTTPIRYKAPAEETTEEAAESLTIAPSNPLTFHIGGEADFAIDVTIDKMTVDNLFAQRDADGNITKIYDDTTFSDLFKTKEGAKEAISIIDNALNMALAEQTKLGAVEARLGYTSDNLTTMNENLEAANSAFRDADLAKEMTNYMKYSVLSQAAQYMLAQAGQNSFSVLNLLQQ